MSDANIEVLVRVYAGTRRAWENAKVAVLTTSSEIGTAQAEHKSADERLSEALMASTIHPSDILSAFTRAALRLHRAQRAHASAVADEARHGAAATEQLTAILGALDRIA